MALRTMVVGGRHYRSALERVRALGCGERVFLLREASNPHDKNAVAVVSDDGVKLGHVPRQDAVAVAQALDSDRELRAFCRRGGTTSIVIINHEDAQWPTKLRR